MDCVNHGGVPASAYCQNCGKALCSNCVRQGAAGQVLCEPCLMAWQSVPNPFVGAPVGAPNPTAAAVLGLIPGVGAMYNGQFFKGLVHVVIFAVLISITDHYAIFGLFIAAWILYQSFEAFHTAKARRDGQPLPDPLGLNELGSWLNVGSHRAGHPGAVPPAGAAPPQPGAGTPGAPYQAPYQTPYQQAPYQAPFGGYAPPSPPPPPGFVDPGMPPGPPAPPVYWRRKEPIAALVLIGLGLLFLLGQLDLFSGWIWKFSWPLLLIGLGVWLMLRRMSETKGGPQ